MKKQNSLFFYVLLFTLAQIAWFSLLGLWIYWYVTNYLILNLVEDKVSPQIISGGANVFALVSGLVLLVMISIAMSLIFIYLTKQMNINRMYDNFIANITHELKSPLSSIQLHLETLQKRPIADEKRQEFLSAMIEDTGRLNNLITSILDIAAIEQKRVAHNYQIYDVDTILNELIEETKFQFRLNDRVIKVEGQTHCPCVLDRTAMKMVMNNLIDNAVKFSKDTLSIKIKLDRNEKYVLIAVSDCGIGINQREQKKIFQKFYRVYNQNIPNVKGTGLGLYWVREIIRYHGGKISVNSPGFNQGTTFKIELPIFKTSRKRHINQLLKISRKSQQLLGRTNDQESI